MKNELTSLKVSCKYNRKAKICTPEKIEQSKKYRTRGWTLKRIGEKMGISESRAGHIVNGEPEANKERRRINSRNYYKENREYCISRCYKNEMLKRANVPGYAVRRKQYNSEYSKERYQSDPEFKKRQLAHGKKFRTVHPEYMKEYRKSKHTVKKD